MRTRRIETVSVERAEIAARRALVASAVVTYGIFVGVHVVGGPPLEIAALSALLLLPYLFALVRRHDPLWDRHRLLSASVATVVQAVPFLALGFARLELVAPAALAFVLGHLMLCSRDARAAGAVLVLGPALVLLELGFRPAGPWLGAFALTLVVAVVGLRFLVARECRRHVLERAPSVLVRDGAGIRGVAASVGGLRETLHGVLLGLLVVLLLPMAYLPIVLLPDPRLERTRAAQDTGTEPEALDARETEAGGTVPGATVEGLFPGDLVLSGNLDPLVDELVVVATPVPARDVGPLYLRGMVLDTIHAEGARKSAGTTAALLADGDDGALDGWTTTAEPPAGSTSVGLHVLQRRMRVGAARADVVFAPRPLLGLELPAARHDPDGSTLAPWNGRDESDWRELRLAYAVRTEVPATAERGADPRYLQLPEESGALEPVRALARRVTIGARDDRERVQRVLDYFHDEFTYARISAEFPGLLGVLDFLEEKRGHCSYYATASTLMLRTLGVPARIATGFLAGTFDPVEGAYVATTRNGHAWIEVQFEGVGWVPLDPTPVGPRTDVLAGGAAGPAEGLRGWLAGLWFDLDGWADTGESVYLRHFLAALFDGPAALLASLRRKPWRALPLIVAAWLALLVARRRRRAESGPVRLGPRRRREAGETLYAQLLAALARLGHARAPAQTPLEFALEVVRRGGEPLRAVVPWTERLYRARYGGEAFTREESRALREFVRRVGDVAHEPRDDRAHA